MSDGVRLSAPGLSVSDIFFLLQISLSPTIFAADNGKAAHDIGGQVFNTALCKPNVSQAGSDIVVTIVAAGPHDTTMRRIIGDWKQSNERR